MCGTIAYENITSKIGNLITYKDNQGSYHKAYWYGHAREESTQPPNSTRVIIPADSYTEKGISFEVPVNCAIDAWLIESPNFPHGGKGIFIITRQALPVELARVRHSRHPRFVRL